MRAVARSTCVRGWMTPFPSPRAGWPDDSVWRWGLGVHSMHRDILGEAATLTNLVHENHAEEQAASSPLPDFFPGPRPRARSLALHSVLFSALAFDYLPLFLAPL